MGDARYSSHLTPALREQAARILGNNAVHKYSVYENGEFIEKEEPYPEMRAVEECEPVFIAEEAYPTALFRIG